MSRSMRAGLGLAVLLSPILAQPVLADEATAAFLANIQRANATLDQMQALFTRMDQRRQAQAAGGAATGQAAPAAGQPAQEK